MKYNVEHDSKRDEANGPDTGRWEGYLELGSPIWIKRTLSRKLIAISGSFSSLTIDRSGHMVIYRKKNKPWLDRSYPEYCEYK